MKLPLQLNIPFIKGFFFFFFFFLFIELLRISGVTLPFCAFNGGSDVWVDVGNKVI